MIATMTRNFLQYLTSSQRCRKPQASGSKTSSTTGRTARQISLFCNLKKGLSLGIGCGSFGRAVASNFRGPRFESSHWQILYSAFIYLFNINSIEKTKINKKRPEMAHYPICLDIFSSIYLKFYFGCSL